MTQKRLGKMIEKQELQGKLWRAMTTYFQKLKGMKNNKYNKNDNEKINISSLSR